ncbi:unnamed protein product, partial [Mesorhabditis belari]|uniref:Uncharacterized protein n=1 Tax=Mesorhabditis belari TaxID=2138241 RepID=A0AAF3EAE9_9BILA
MIFLLLHDEIDAQTSSQTMSTNVQPTSAQFTSMNLFPILQQFPLTFEQHEVLHQKAQEEFFRQQKQIRDQVEKQEIFRGGESNPRLACDSREY